MNDTNPLTNINNNPDASVSETVEDNQTGKPGKGKVRITEDQVAKARKLLANLKPVKKKAKDAKPGFSGQDFVREMYQEIVTASDKGYTMVEIAEMLTKQAKVEIPPNTLKNYMSRAKAERQKQSKGGPVEGTTDTASSPAAQTAQSEIEP